MLNSQDPVFQWLMDEHFFKISSIQPLVGDASTRRYYRVHGHFPGQAVKDYILMESRLPEDNTSAFIKVAHLFRTHQLQVPIIHHINPSKELLLLEDFGDRLLLNELNDTNLDIFYRNAIDIIVKLQKIPAETELLPAFDKNYMLKEMQLFQDWFVLKHLNYPLTETERNLIQTSFNWIGDCIAKQEKTIIHRDFHSRNLMILDQNKLGVIDFQDAMIGPRAYDLVSLLKDCYIVWDEKTQKKWCQYYAKASDIDFTSLWSEFEICGLQRHLKVLGIFCRLYYRDGKNRYLADLPTVWRYTLDALSTITELSDFYQWMLKMEPLFLS